MSGFEIAGAVLGAIPLVISALQHYKNGLRTIQRWRKYERELQCLIRNVETERVKLQNVCEKLLDGLVPPSQIDAMVENPGGQLWMNEDVEKKIRARLWRSWTVFEQTLKDIQVAINDISDKIGIGSDVQWSDTSLVAKELKRAGFTLRRSAYEGLLATVKDGISTLESLARIDIELEPSRRVRSRIRLLNILRNLSSSVYRAICSSLTCTCKHSISMRISDCMDDDITPAHDEEHIIEKLQVHLALSLPQSQLGESPNVVINGQWEELLLRASLPLQTPTQTPSALPDTNKPVKSSIKPKKTVKFFLSRLSSSTTTMVQTETSVTENFTTSMSLGKGGAVLPMPNIQSIINICGELKKPSATRKPGCLGTISDQIHANTRSYSVYPLTSSTLTGKYWKMVSLRDGLEAQGGVCPPTYKQRLRLSVFIVRSVLQLYKTPWLPEMPGSRDIFFIQSGSFSYYDRPFLMAKSEKSKGKSRTVSLIRNPTLLAIGVLLIELLRGQTIESLQVPEEILGDDLYPLSLYMTARRLLGEVAQASSNYGSAVSRCIDGEFQEKNLENEDDRHDIYCGVIALLEEDLNNS